MPRIIDDDENEGEDSPASLRKFIVPDDDDNDDRDGPAPSVVTPRRLEDVIGFIEAELRGLQVAGFEDHLNAARETYERLAHDCLVLAFQAEADWKPGFRKLLRKSIGARIKADADKNSVRDEDVCAACGRDEERSNMRLDLFGSYELRNLCQPADLKQKWGCFSKESTTPTDYGSFYLGNECLRKLQTSFLLRTHISDLVGAVARRIEERASVDHAFALGTWGAKGFELTNDGGIALYFRNRRERLELATANRRHWPPILAANRELFGKIDLMRTRAGCTPKFLYELGLKVIEEGNKEGADDDDPGLRDDADNDCEEGEEEEEEESEEESGGAGPSQAWTERRAEAREAARAATRAQTQAQATAEGPPSTRTRGRQRDGKPPQKPVSPIGKRRLPKKRARGVIESSDDDTVQEPADVEDEADDPADAEPDESPPAQALSLADLSGEGAVPSRKKAVADLHHLAGKLTELGMQQEARIAAAAAFVASEMLDELGARGTR